MSKSSLVRVLEPRKIAVVGASAEPLKVGGRIMRSIRTSGFEGPVYAVNPKASDILGYPCFASLKDVPEKPDLVAISVPIKAIYPTIDEAKALGAGGAIICAAGFAELGDEGVALQKALTDHAGPDFRLFGPNTQGYVNASIGLSVNFSHRFVAYPAAPVKGGEPVGILSQGGGGGSHLYEAASQAGLDITHYYPTGNEADIDFIEIAEYLIKERGVKHVLCMVEMVRRPEGLRAVAELAAARGATIGIFLSAQRPAGLRAAASHTASLGTQPRAWRAFCEQTGIISAASVTELVDAAVLRVKGKRSPKGPRVGVLTNSGSAAVMIADACDEFGLEVPPLSKEAQEIATKIAGRSYIQLSNPLDVGLATDAQRLHPHLVELIKKEGFDSFIFAVANQYADAGADIDSVVQMIRGVSQDAGVPVVPIWPMGDAAGPKAFEDNGLPVFRDVRPAVLALSRLWNANRLRPLTAGPEEGQTNATANASAQVASADFADEDIAKKTIAKFGLRIPGAIVVSNAKEAKIAAEKLGSNRVVIKGLRPGLLHKTERGLVRIGIPLSKIEEEFQLVRDAADKTAAVEPGGPFTFLVEEMLDGAVAELLLSVRRQPSVGLTLTVGWGGSAVELLDDIACVTLPASRPIFEDALRSLRCFPLLGGFRGRPGGSIESVLKAMENLQTVALNMHADVEGIEINPLAVRQHDAVVLDVIAELAGEGA